MGVTLESVEALVGKLLDEHPPASTDATTFLGARFDAGLMAVHLPPGCGGLGADPNLQTHVDLLLRAAEAPDPFVRAPIAVGFVGPTIAVHGTEAQRDRYLRRMFTGEDEWCQLFSEPGAGSDLASLATRAEARGDGWIINGQKVWTSNADRAAYGLLLARTDPGVPKSKGITAFLVDMASPGIEVRPLRQMTGDAEFNEVFFHDVNLPTDAQLGEAGQGWRVAMTTLMSERGSIGSAFAASGSGPVRHAVEAYRSSHAGDAVLRDRVTRMWIEAEVIRLLSDRVTAPGSIGPVLKLLGAEHTKRIRTLVVELLGAEGMLLVDHGEGSPWNRGPHIAFLRAQAATIEGGTSELMRNVLAEQVLGLPRDDHGPRDRPWRDVPRSLTS
jgi:alkylation response protein AidB-like acyl-CoA dehydrogenase